MEGQSGSSKNHGNLRNSLTIRLEKPNVANPYIPVQALPKGVVPRRRAGVMLLGETKQSGLIEQLNDRVGAYSLPFLSKYARVIAVATGTKSLKWVAKLPSKDPVREFSVEVSIRVSTIAPARMAVSTNYD